MQALLSCCKLASVWPEALLGPFGIVFEVVREILGSRSSLNHATLVPSRPLLIESLVMGERHTDIEAWTRRVEVERRNRKYEHLKIDNPKV